VKTYRIFVGRGVTPIVIAASLIAASVPVPGQADIGANPVTAEDAATRQNHMRERMRAHLDRMSKRLKINASQQDAWAAYTKTVEGLFGTRPAKSAADADAAAVMRFRADLAKEHAQKLTQLADATAKLQQVLDPEQRKTLNEIVRYEGSMRSHKDHHGDHRRDQ
jgi:membrane peptidoglycan carboxypeptidase